MADTRSAGVQGYRPEMDAEAHEKTYDAFTHFTTIGTVFVTAIVVALAVGGVKGAWISALIMIILAHVAAGLGLVSKALSWRPGAAVLAVLLLMLLLY